ncbi:hypothetical protein [Clostridium mediterraneense]|nr:hypothetical protein [Clostridium mediterraneense]
MYKILKFKYKKFILLKGACFMKKNSESILELALEFILEVIDAIFEIFD